MNIIRKWVGGDGFTYYPELEAETELFAALLLNKEPIIAAEFAGNREPWDVGDIVFTDWKGGHKVIVVTAVRKQDGEYVYEGVPLSSANGDRKYEGSVRLKDYNSILRFGPKVRNNYGVYVQVANVHQFTNENYQPSGAFKGHVTDQFLRALSTWLKLPDDKLMNLKTIW